MATPAADKPATVSRAMVIESIVGVVLVGLVFAAIAAADVASARTYLSWTVLVVVYAVVAFVADRMHAGRFFAGIGGLLPIVLHWLGVFLAVQLIYFMVSSGRIDDPDTGLVNGLILALGTFLAGVHGNWRLIVLGVALGLLTAGMAVVETYLWVLMAVAVFVIVALAVGSKLLRRGKYVARAAS